MKLSWHKITLLLQTPFRLAYNRDSDEGLTQREIFWLRLEDDSGWGECAIPPYYGYKQEDFIAYWQKMAQSKTTLPQTAEEIGSWLGEEGPAPARCALDLALHDYLAKQAGLPLYRMLNLPEPRPMYTSYTIAIDTPEEMVRLANEFSHFPIIKIKLGSENDLVRLQAIRSARPTAHILVDANTGWSRQEALDNLKALEELNIELIEQPLAKEDFEGMGILQRATAIPIVADESLQKLSDVEALARHGIRAINIKLMKTGGISAALKIIKQARTLDMKIMLGCMVETSLGITAMANLMGFADWLDLDSPLNLSNDPFKGVTYDQQGRLHLPDKPGIGAEFKEQ